MSADADICAIATNVSYKVGVPFADTRVASGGDTHKKKRVVEEKVRLGKSIAMLTFFIKVLFVTSFAVTPLVALVSFGTLRTSEKISPPVILGNYLKVTPNNLPSENTGRAQTLFIKSQPNSSSTEENHDDEPGRV